MADNNRTRVLIVDDDDDTCDGVAQLLRIHYRDSIEVVGFAENGAVAVERVKKLHPHIVLMDVNMPVMNGIEATDQIIQIAPQTRIIMVTVQDSTEYIQKAFRVRAVDYVVKPIRSEDLFEAIDRYLVRPEQPQAPAVPAPPTQTGHIIGLLGFKGGAGKTTLAVNLGIGLVKAHKKVVLVDGDILFGDVGISLNVKGENTILDMARMAADPDDMDLDVAERIMATHESGLRVLLAPPDPGQSMAISSAAITHMLDFLKQHFDYVIVDTSRNIDDILLATIQSADCLIVVTTAAMSALKDTRFMLSELAGVSATKKAMLVLNQVDRRNRVTPEQIANHLKLPIAVQIPFDANAINALNSGIGLVALDPQRAWSAQPLQELVGAVRRRVEAARAPVTVAEGVRKSLPV